MTTTIIIFEDGTTITFNYTIKLQCLERGLKWLGTHSNLGIMVHDTINYKYNLIKTENNITEIKASYNIGQTYTPTPLPKATCPVPCFPGTETLCTFIDGREVCNQDIEPESPTYGVCYSQSSKQTAPCSKCESRAGAECVWGQCCGDALCTNGKCISSFNNRIYVKDAEYSSTLWTYSRFWQIPSNYLTLKTLLGKYWIDKNNYSINKLNLWTTKAFENLSSYPFGNPIPGIPTGVNAYDNQRQLISQRSIVSYAKISDIMAELKQTIYFVEENNLETFLKEKGITRANSSTTDPKMG